MKTKSDKNLRIMAATMMTLFSLLTVFSASIAWFGMNKDVDAGGNQIVVTKPSGKLASIDFYSFDDIITDETGVIGYKFFPTIVGSITFDYANDTVSSTGNTNITLENYTPLNKEHPLLLVFNLSDEYALQPNQLRIEAVTQRTGFLGARQTDGTPVYEDLTDAATYLRYDSVSEKYFYALSSVTRFLYQELTDAAYDTLKLGTTLDFAFANLTNHENFVSIISGAETSTFNSNPKFYSSSQSSVAHVALVIDYFPDAIEYIYSTYLGNNTLENTYDYELLFECDWSLEVLG